MKEKAFPQWAADAVRWTKEHSQRALGLGLAALGCVLAALARTGGGDPFQDFALGCSWAWAWAAWRWGLCSWRCPCATSRKNPERAGAASWRGRRHFLENPRPFGDISRRFHRKTGFARDLGKFSLTNVARQST